MAGTDVEAGRLAPQGFQLDARVLRQFTGVGDEELDVFGKQPLEQELPVADLDAQVRLREVAAKRRQQRRQEGGRRIRPDAESIALRLEPSCRDCIDISHTMHWTQGPAGARMPAEQDLGLETSS
jgi:hypothetical protein